MNAPLKYAELEAPFQAPLEAFDLTIQLESRAQKRLTLRKLKNSFGPLAFVVCLAGFLIWAWLNSDNGVLTPKDGTGYWFGIAGTTMMGIVLLYPLRKRIKLLRDWGELPRWFRLHMVLGLCGPALIVAHSNFSVHSANAFVAFVAMLVVAASGVVGRYLYAQTHRGLYGAKLEAKELLSEVSSIRKKIGVRFLEPSAWEARLQEFEAAAIVQSKTFMGAIAHNFQLGRLERKTRKSLLLGLEKQVRREQAILTRLQLRRSVDVRHFRARIDRYFRAVRRAGNLTVYERFFALWHVMHLPLIAFLVVTTLIHIVAVNMY